MADTNYDSRHTGPEIDDAIDRAKVGGEIDTTLANKAPAGYGGFGEEIPHHGAFTSDENLVEWLTTEINSLPIGASEQVRFALYNYDYWSGGDWYGVLTNKSGYGTLLVSSYGSTYGSNCQGQMIRQFANNVWGPWEWVNPPMVLGVEYRTTERYLGKPVYVKVVDCGNLPASGLKNIAHKIANCKPIQVYGEMSNGNTLPYTTASSFCISADANYIQIYVTGDLSSQTVKATIKFTKTTD